WPPSMRRRTMLPPMRPSPIIPSCIKLLPPYLSSILAMSLSQGIRIVRSGELDHNTPQTPGMTRAAAITHARTGAEKLWAGTVVVEPNARTGPHHHGELETVLYIVRGRARFRWGER